MNQPRLDDITIDDLVAQYLADYRRGQHSSVGAFARQYPQWEEDLLELVPAAVAIERLKVERQSGGRSSSGDAGDTLVGRQLGDYLLLEEIGRGGMGVVYKARQTSLGRIVAVKVLRRSALHRSKQVKRFQREARAAAQLHHTNIVPVFGVGTQQDVHYYVMQLIEGEGVDQIVNEIYVQTSFGAPPASTGDSTTGAESRRNRAAEVAELLLGATAAAVKPSQRGENEKDGNANSTTVARRGSSTMPTLNPLFESRDADSSPSGERPSSATLQRQTGTPAERNPALGRRYWANIARIGCEAAQALDYAHR